VPGSPAMPQSVVLIESQMAMKDCQCLIQNCGGLLWGLLLPSAKQKLLVPETLGASRWSPAMYPWMLHATIRTGQQVVI